MIRIDEPHIPAVIRRKLSELEALCRKNYVRRLDVFGSALRDDFDPSNSDLDFIVDFRDDAPPGGLHGPYFTLLFDLKDLFGREIDLVEYVAVRNPYFRKELDETRVPIYAE
ncbi:MAG: nucleotidyltransferase domain-containing protein [Phycisphaeraceae bacterium]